MSAGTLGVGARVWLGWAPPHHVEPGAEVALFKFGTVLGGPVYLGRQRWAHWSVRFDALPAERYLCAERYLVPIDDGDVDHEREHREIREPIS